MRRVVVVVAAVSTLIMGCGDEPVRTTTLRVLAASSLTEAFTELGRAFESARPTAKVSFTFGASSGLVRQVLDGAPADVLATADEESMRPALDAGRVTESQVFARNALTIVVERGNPKRVKTVGDLARTNLSVALCAPEVPCGRYAASALQAAEVSVRPVTLEENVKGVLTKVALGEVDAGIVYATDAETAGDTVEGVPIVIEGVAPEALQATYLMGAVADSKRLELASQWMRFVDSFEGQQILSTRGFLPT